MTRYDALRIRGFLTWLFNKDEERFLYAAIAKTYKQVDADDWTVYIYGDNEESIFLVEAATLCNALENIFSSYHASIGHYDAGTTSPDVRTAITLH